MPIVEGPGDVRAAPVLIRRILYERLGRYDIQVSQPKNAGGKSSLLKGIGKFVRYCLKTPPRCDAILVMVDSDSDCALDLVRRLREDCRSTGPGVPIAVVCAVREYESWFLADLPNVICGTAGLARDPEGVSGAKEALRILMPGMRYRETTDQARFSSQIDLARTSDNSRSFRRLCHAVEELANAIDSGEAGMTPAL